MFKDIRKAPVSQTSHKAVGARYLVETYRPKKKSGAAPTSDALSPLHDSLAGPARAKPNPNKKGQAAAAVELPRGIEAKGPLADFSPLGAALGQAPKAQVAAAPPPMPEALGAGLQAPMRRYGRADLPAYLNAANPVQAELAAPPPLRKYGRHDLPAYLDAVNQGVNQGLAKPAAPAAPAPLRRHGPLPGNLVIANHADAVNQAMADLANAKKGKALQPARVPERPRAPQPARVPDPAPQAIDADVSPGFSPLADAARGSPDMQAPQAAPAANVARKAWMHLRRMAQKDSPVVPADTAADFNVPVVAAHHAQGTVRDSNDNVRLLHGREAAAQGSFGRFYRAITPEGELRGIKQVNTSGAAEWGYDGLEATPRHELVEEVNHMRRLGMTIYAIHETPQNTMLVESELFAGTLSQAFKNIPRTMRSAAARSALEQQAQQLDHFHAAGFMHRDIKSENTLFTEKGLVQVADPGLATKLREGARHGCTGTQPFMAPEVLNAYDSGRAVYDAKVDTWSLGVVACESLVNAHWPLSFARSPEATKAAQKQLFIFRESVMRNGEIDLKAVADCQNDQGWGAYFHQLALADKGMCKFVLGRMFDPNPKTRATMQEVIAASKDVSTATKVVSTLTLNTANMGFKIAAQADKKYQAEVTKLQGQRLNHLAPPAGVGQHL